MAGSFASFFRRTARRVVIGGSIIALGILAGIATFSSPKVAPLLLGLSLVLCGLIQAADALWFRDRAAGKAELFGSTASVITGLLLLASDKLVFSALALFLGAWWIVDGLGKLAMLGRHSSDASRIALLFDAAVNLLIGLAIAIRWPISAAWVVYLAASVRLISAGWTILLGRDAETTVKEAAALTYHPDRHLGLPPHDLIAEMRGEIDGEEATRWRIDRSWIILLLVTFFFIHVGRMDAEWNLVGFMSPGIALLGDVIFSLFLAYFVVVPIRLVWRFCTRFLERRAWRRRMAAHDAGRSVGWLPSATNRWLRKRMRFDLHLERIWTSPTAAMRRGLEMGIPITAILIASAPLLGVSWFFDTETWATLAWNQWAGHRADAWRAAMVQSITSEYQDSGIAPDEFFTIRPEVAKEDDFSFIVIGDTGEGDASQLILKDQLLKLGARPDVKFLILSSDVIYPQGAMKDYEAKFYLPFKGFEKPIYAIPGNHDWFDALDAFAANLMEPKAARAAMRARREVDLRLTSTTAERIDDIISQAGRLRGEYQLKTGLQRGPFFDVQTVHFALIAIDTGMFRTIDEEQRRWLKAALERSRGKFTMALLGHPRFAGGHDVTLHDKEFAELHDLLRQYDVEVNMAGDTHDFEFYREPYQRAGQDKSMLHFVNGGGGAYLSIGTALDWPKKTPTADCAFYPRADAITDKLNAEVPLWKRPLWWWVRDLGAWPTSPEVMAAAFASNRAPFYQSFMEVRVQPSAGVVRLLAYTANGPMRWSDLERFGTVVPTGVEVSAPVEFVLPLRGVDPSLKPKG